MMKKHVLTATLTALALGPPWVWPGAAATTPAAWAA